MSKPRYWLSRSVLCSQLDLHYVDEYINTTVGDMLTDMSKKVECDVGLVSLQISMVDAEGWRSEMREMLVITIVAEPISDHDIARAVDGYKYSVGGY